MQSSNRKPAHFGRLTSALGSGHEAGVFKAADKTISLWHRTAAEMFGYTASAVIGETDTIIILPDESRCWYECEKRPRSGNSIRRVNVVRVTKTRVRINLRLTAISGDENCPTSLRNRKAIAVLNQRTVMKVLPNVQGENSK